MILPYEIFSHVLFLYSFKCHNLDHYCSAFAAPPHSAISNHAAVFDGGDTQTIICDAGFKAAGSTDVTCVNNANYADWQPAPDQISCGNVLFGFL